MSRARLIASVLLALAACGDDGPEDAPPTPMSDALVPMSYEGGALEDRITIGPDPRDAAITEATPILDLPLVIARPDAPLSTSTLEVRVTDTTGYPLPGVGVSTGGPAVFTSTFGLATVSAVYGTDFTDVFAFHSERTLAHARVAIRPGAPSSVELVLAAAAVYRVPDAGVAHRVPDEEWLAAVDASRPPDVQVAFVADAFEVPWGGVAKGPTLTRITALREPEAAAALPGGMQAIVDGERVPLAGVMAFEVRVAQGATPLELVRDATVSVTWPDGSAGIDLAAQQLFVFDAERGAFVAAGALDVTSSPAAAVATIDRLGTWLIAAPAIAAHCARLDVRSGSEPLARAGLLLTSESAFAMARAELDDAGASCALLAAAGPYAARAFGGGLGGRLVTAEGVLQTGTVVASCEESCSTAVLEGEPIEVGCVRGTIDLAALGFDVASVLVRDGDETTGATLPANEPFCLDVRPGAELSFDTTSYRCGIDPVTVVTSSAGASCGGDGCQDLGTIRCCQQNEGCSVLGADDDCDGLVDEGCTCASGCAATSVSVDRCCDPSNACGERSAITDECVSFEGFGIPIECETITVPGLNGDVGSATGCCRSDGQCGVMWDAFGCIAAADVPRVWGPATTLTSRTCTP